MKYCMTCGSKLEDGVKFCTVCGQPVESADAATAETSVVNEPKPKKKFPKWIIAAVLAVAVLAGGAYYAISSGVFTPAPQQFVKLQNENVVQPAVDAFSTYVASVLSGEAVEDVAEKLGIDTDVTLTVEQDFDEDIQDEYLDDSSVTLQINNKEEDKLFGFELNLMGSDVLTGVLVFGEDYIGIQLPELDDEYYTVDFDDLADILVNVAGLDEDTVQQVMDAITGIKDGADVSADDVKAILGKYVDIAFGAVTKDNTEKEKVDLKLEGLGKTEKGCQLITFTPSAEDIEGVVTALAEAFIDDDDLRDLVEVVCDSMGETAGFTMDDYDRLVDEIEENYEQAAEEAGEWVEDNEFFWSVAVKGTRVFEIKIYSEELEEGLSYESYGDVAGGRCDALCLYEEGDANVMLQNDVKLKGKTVEGELEGNGDYIDSDIEVSYSFDLLKKSGLNIPYGSVEGKIDDNDFELNVEEADEGGTLHEITVETYDGNVTLYAVSTDKASEVSAPKGSGTAVTMDNIIDIIQGMATEAMSIFAEIFS